MTPTQIAELERLNAAIAAAPDATSHYHRRAHFYSKIDGEFALAVADVHKALQIVLSRKSGKEWQLWLDGLTSAAANAWKLSVRKPEGAQAKIQQVNAVASFQCALTISPELARWRAALPPTWDALEWLKTASRDGAKVTESQGATDIGDLKAWALALALTDRDTSAASQVYVRALQLQYGPTIGAPFCERRSRGSHLASYQKLAWLDLAVQNEPNNPRWILKRSRWKVYRKSMADITRAIELAPTDPRGYEARAKMTLSLKRDWWDNSPASEMPAADHLRALRLRIKAGQIADSAQSLAAQGDQLISRFPDENERARKRAHAFYSLAIEREPDNASYYLARARTIDTPSEFEAQANDPISEAVARGALPNYTRALALDSRPSDSHNLARVKIVALLNITLRHPTAHEQIEALLNARQTLRDAGIEAQLASEIIGEVERALAE